MKKLFKYVFICVCPILFSACEDNSETVKTDTESGTIVEQQQDIENDIFTIHYFLNNDDATIDELTQTVEYGKEFELKEPIYNQEEYNFLGWFDDNNVVVSDGVYNLKSDLNLTGKWETIWSPFY